MHDLNPTNWIFWFGIITILSMLLPVAAILIRQQFRLSFIALIIYLLFTCFYNFLMLLLPGFPADVKRAIGVVSNYIDAPLIMIFLLYLTYNKQVLRLMKIILTCYLIFETIVIALFGFSIKSITIFSGPGILIILFFAFLFFTRHVRIAISQRNNVPKTLMASGILFAYTIYFLVYLFYYVFHAPEKTDALIIYFFASFITSVLLTIGLLKEKKVAGPHNNYNLASRSGFIKEMGSLTKNNIFFR